MKSSNFEPGSENGSENDNGNCIVLRLSPQIQKSNSRFLDKDGRDSVKVTPDFRADFYDIFVV